MLSSMLTFALLAGAVLVALSALLYWRQESFIFFPRPNDAVLARKHQANRVQIRSPGAALEGWWAANPRATTSAVVIYFGGNAEDVLYTATTAPLLNAQRTLVVNYRGYGGNRGKPSQAALYEDALAIYDYVVKSGVAPADVFLLGRSLGSAMAVKVASERPVAGVALITPFDSLAAVGARHYWFLPVRLLLRHPFPSHQWARTTRAPALLIAAAQDRIVPPVHAERLAQAWAGPKRLHVLADVGHNNIELHPEYYSLINAFLGAPLDALH